MIKNAIILLFIASFIAGCQSREVAQLRKENILLKSQLNDPTFLRVEFSEVNRAMGKVDASRKSGVPSGEIRSAADLTVKLADLAVYIEESEKKRNAFEKELEGLRNETSAYTMMVFALKGEVSIRDEDVLALSSTLKDFQQQNAGLLDSIRLQQNHAVGLSTDIEHKQQTLSLLESKMIRMESDFKRTEAEVYYAKGQLSEESARHVRLAPQKRRQAYTEALELYKKACVLGKKEAEQNIIALEQTLGITRQTKATVQTSARAW